MKIISAVLAVVFTFIVAYAFGLDITTRGKTLGVLLLISPLVAIIGWLAIGIFR